MPAIFRVSPSQGKLHYHTLTKPERAGRYWSIIYLGQSAQKQANWGQGRAEFGFDILDLSSSEYQQPLNFLPNQSPT